MTAALRRLRDVSDAGQWLHLVGATAVTMRSGGPALTALYLVLLAAPVLIMRPSRVWAALAPAAAGVVALLAPSAGPHWLAAAGLAAGIGIRGAGLNPAWLAGVTAPAGWGSVVGAVASVVLTALGLERPMLALAAVLMLGGLVGRGEEETRRPVGADQEPRAAGRELAPLAFAAAFVAGLRVLEGGFDLGRPPAPAVFALAWVAGARVGWRPRPPRDVRPVLASSFLAAGALGFLGITPGPAAILIYGAVGGLVALGSSGATGGSGSQPRLTAAAAGAAWAAISPSYETATAVGALAALGGGFASLALVRRRIRLAEPATASPRLPSGYVPPLVRTSAELPLPRVPEAVPPGETDERPESAPATPEEAAILLLAASRRAREIRRRALEGFHAPPDPAAKMLLIAEGLERAAASARTRLTPPTTSKEP